MCMSAMSYLSLFPCTEGYFVAFCDMSCLNVFSVTESIVSNCKVISLVPGTVEWLPR